LNLDAENRIFVVSDVERRNLLRAGITDEKIIVIQNGVDTESFAPALAVRQFAESWASRKTRPSPDFVGTFGPCMAC